jgi:hypothetical protein
MSRTHYNEDIILDIISKHDMICDADIESMVGSSVKKNSVAATRWRLQCKGLIRLNCRKVSKYKRISGFYSITNKGLEVLGIAKPLTLEDRLDLLLKKVGAIC